MLLVFALSGCASRPAEPPPKPFKLRHPAAVGISLFDGRSLESRLTRQTTDGFLAGDVLLEPQPARYVGAAIQEAIAAHEWSNLIQQWLSGKSVSLKAFDVLVDKGQLAVPWQARYENLPPAQGAMQHVMLSVATELKRPERVAVNIEVSIGGQSFAGVGYGPYSEPKAQAVAGPAFEAIRSLVAEIAEAAAGLPRSLRPSQNGG